MSRSKELAKNTVVLFIGVFFTKIISYLLLPLYTGFLSTAEYGTVDLFRTIVSLAIPVIGLQIEQGVFRYLIASRNKNDDKIKYISASLVFVILSSIIFIGLSSIILIYINNEYKWLVLLNILLSYYSSYLMQLARGLGDNKNYSIAGVIISLITIIFNIIFLVGVGLKIDGMLYASAIGYFIGTIYVFIRLNIIKYISFKAFDKKCLKKMLQYSLPMIPNSLSWWIFSSSDRIIVSSFLGVSSNGILSIAYKFSNIIIIIYNVFNMSITESVSLHIDDDDIEDFFSNIYNKIGNIFTSLGAIIISFMPFAFKILINKSFFESYQLIPPAIIASLFQVYAMNFGIIYVAKTNTKSVAFTSIVSAIINIISDLALIKFIGVYAAIISTIISYVVLFIYRYMDINKKYMKVKLDKLLLCNISIVVFIICGLYYINTLFSNLVSILISITTLLIFNKDSIIIALQKIKDKKYFKLKKRNTNSI